MSQLHVNQIMGVLRRTFEGLIDLADVAHLDVTNRGSVFLSRALASFAVAQLAALGPAEAAQAVTDGAGDNGVDALYYDRATKTLYVVQSKWFGSGRGSFDVGETMKLVKGFDDLVAQRFDRFNARVAAKRGMVEAAFLDDKASYVLVMVHTGQDDLAPEPRQVIDDCLDRFNDWKDETTRELLQVRCLKQSDVYGMIARGTQGDPIDLEVVMHEWGKVENPFAVYGQVSAADVADWWAKYYPRLVEPNIRGFLGADTDVNAGLQQTLLHEPEHFWHYNNGLTVVCRTITRRMMGGPGREAAYIVCQGASIVNGAQTAGSIAAAHVKRPEAVARARVPARFIEVGAAATDLGLAITRATNTQNRINRQDFVALDPEQERLRAELAVEGIAYHYKSGEAVVRNETTFDLEEATVALACAHPDLAFSTQAKREIGRLWEDTSRAPYKALFNGSTSSAALWRDVRLLRAVEGALQARQQTLEGRDKGFAVHGNRFVAHNVFRLLDGIGSSDTVAEARVPAAVEAVLEATMKAANDAFPGAYLAQLFKNQNKLTQLESSLPRWMVTA